MTLEFKDRLSSKTDDPSHGKIEASVLLHLDAGGQDDVRLALFKDGTSDILDINDGKIRITVANITVYGD